MAPDNMKSIPKCEDCRVAKAKCKPPNRDWDNGKKKCERCEEKGLDCGANVRTNKKEKPPSQPSGSTTSAAGENSSSLSMQDVPDVGRETADVRGAVGVMDERPQNLQSLEDNLKRLDREEEIVHQLHLVHSALHNRQRQLPPEHPYKNEPENAPTAEILESAKADLLVLLNAVSHQAEAAAEAGDSTEADRAYLRASNVYRCLPFDVSAPYSEFLMKIAAFCSKIDHQHQAEKHWRQVVQLPQAPKSVLDEAWKQLAKSLPKTSEGLKETLLSKTIGALIPPTVRMPFPPWHRWLGTQASGEVLGIPQEVSKMRRDLDITGSPLIQSAITRECPIVFYLILACPLSDLIGESSRDFRRRTPLFIAAETKEENVGFNIMNRFRDQHVLRRQLVNDMDYLGQTILAVAISSKCSSQFIDELLKFGAEPEPLSLPGIGTPLQAANSRGDEDIVTLLHSHIAKRGNAYRGEGSASELANAGG